MAMSERGTLNAVLNLLEREPLSPGVVKAIDLLTKLRAQVGKGIHVNPALLVYGNPGGETCFSKDVLAILYRHADDGQEYCHGFGNADIRLTSQGNAVTIHGLKRKTGVGMYAGRDGATVVLRKPGTRLVEDF